MDPLREFPRRLQATEVGWEGRAGETGWSRSPRREKGGVRAGRRTSGDFFFFFLMLKAREDAIRSHSVGGRRLRNVPDKDESGKLTGSTKRPCLLPALNFTGGRGSGKSHIQ